MIGMLARPDDVAACGDRLFAIGQGQDRRAFLFRQLGAQRDAPKKQIESGAARILYHRESPSIGLAAVIGKRATQSP